MEVVVPLAGNDFERPDGTTKAEMLVDGQPLLLQALWSRSWWRRGDVAASNFCFVLRDTAVGRRFAEGPLTDWFPGARHVFLSHMTAGAAFSVAAGVALCDPLAPLCIDLADILYQEDFDATATFAADAGLGGIALTFCSDLPVYSYVRTDEQGRVLEAAEKRVISGQASAGTYFFRNAGIYAQALGHAVAHRESQTHQGIYFVCPLFNGVIDAGLDVRSVPVREILDVKV
ncbi:hypothetical protein PMI04_005140 [Sphingobium sp. AP49]|uniref:hypothetical protein n=1 Tax=Sphingobium sp. AP49 TaxID=1144307 RepID=UPI00026EE1D1|nr:hypothetical protein [Sphingobium sp. AP49]WHO39981.1 hypothetical protein PMI04_005140 [Sphingobium sp. AP49]